MADDAPQPGLARAGARQRQKQQTRRALLEAARTVLARRGLAQTTTREIAREAGVAAGTFFVHFEDVGALVEALLDEHVARTLSSALRSASRRPGLVAQLVYVSKALYESYDREPELSRAYMSSSLFRQHGAGRLSARLAGFQAWVSQRIDQAVCAHEIPAIDRQLAFTSFFSLYFGLLVAGLNGVLPRKRQLWLLTQALSRLFLLQEVGR